MPGSTRSTVEGFVATRGTAEAVAAANAMIGAKAGAPRSLLLFGPTGVGKTHLLRVIAAGFARREPGGSIVSLSARDLVEDMVAALRAERVGELTRGLRQATLVCVDDLQVLRNRPRTQKEVGLLLGSAAAAGACVIGAAGCARASLGSLVAGLPSGRATGVIEMRRPSARDLRRILKEIAARRGVAMSARGVTTLANGCGGDVGRGLGALARKNFEESLRSPSAR